MRTLLLSALVLLAACGGRPHASPPDAGGVGAQGCDDTLVSVEVTVLDARSAPVPGATVMATHLKSGYTQTGTTDETGRSTSVTEDIGEGTVRVKAILDSRVSDTGQVEFVCSEGCCTAEPKSLTLHFKD